MGALPSAKETLTMKFRLVDKGWDKELDDALRADRSSLQIVSPFIKLTAAKRLLRQGQPKRIQIITRYNLDDFYKGVSDISALRYLLENGAKIRGVKKLHAKLYIFGESRVIVTSVNLTESALTKNHEFGIVAEEAGFMTPSRQYFDDLWNRAGENLQARKLTEWDRKVTKHLAGGGHRATTPGLGDEGVDVGFSSDSVVLPGWVANAEQAFVKFFGISSSRVPFSMPVMEEVERTGCHWACTYPIGKRPRQVNDGAIIFIGRLVKEPKDILIFGRAIGMQHVPGRDDASESDIAQREWKTRWPHYIRVHGAEFVDGTLGNGVSLNELMDTFGPDAFASTQENLARKSGNTNPRKAYSQQAAVRLSAQGMNWLNERLEKSLLEHGRITPSVLKNLDWPDVPPEDSSEK